MKSKVNKESISLLVVCIITLIALISTVTYAYLKAQIDEAESINANLTTGTVDTLTFTKGEDIALNVVPSEFSSGGSNATGATEIIARLFTNNNEETYYYNVYLEITKNNLEYSSFKEIEGTKTLEFKTRYDKTLGNNIDYNGLTNGYEGIPELFLTVSKNGATYTNIEGLKKATLKEENDSYDITELREGIYPIAEDIAIKTEENSDGRKEDKWEVKITFKNLDSDQQLNTNKTFNARIIIQKEKIANDLMDVCSSGDKLSECIQRLHDNSVYGASNLIFHDGQDDETKGETSGTLEAGDNSYRYTGPNEKVNNYICLGSSCSTDPKDPTYHNLYRIVGVFGSDGIKVVKADYANSDTLGKGTQKPSNSDLSSVNTETDGSCWSCLSDGTTYGPTNNEKNNSEEKDAFSHRYKGLFTQVDRYRWQENGTDKTSADWPTSLLNKIHLNNVYLNKIETNYQSLIKDHTWIWGNDNATWDNIAIAKDVKTAYDNEIGSTANQQTDLEKIGLLYVSDYLYGASQENWKKQPYNNQWTYVANHTQDKYNTPIGKFNEGIINNDYRSSTDSNWLYMGLWEWTITQRNDWTNGTQSPVTAFNVNVYGLVHGDNSAGINPFSVRPSFYLESNAKYKGGTGTASDPYILDVSNY